MTKKTAAKVADQADLLSAQPQPAVSKGEIAKADTKPKGEIIEFGGAPDIVANLRRLGQVKKGDVAVAKEIAALIREEQDRIAAREYNAAMLACQMKLPAITRDSYNKHTKSFWAKLEKISKVSDPIIHQHGFALSYSMGTPRLPEHYLMICDVSHTGGHVRRYEMDVGMDHKGPKGEGTKSLAQGSGSSVTFARRYLKCSIFDLVIEGEDNDGNGARAESKTIEHKPIDDTVVVTPEQRDRIIEAIEDCGAKRDQVLRHYSTTIGKKLTQVDQIPRDLYQDVLDACKRFKENAEGIKAHG